jgi:hypothetical protein
MQLVTVGEECWELNIPPPYWSPELPEKMQLVTAGEEPLLYIPPPSSAELPWKMQLVTAGEE